MDVKQVVLKVKGNYPGWFDEECRKGKVKVNYDDNGDVISAAVHTPVKIITAHIGDSIIKSKAGLHVASKSNGKKGKNVKKAFGG